MMFPSDYPPLFTVCKLYVYCTVSDDSFFSLQVTVLRSLRHPSVVSLLGVPIQPRAIVLELAPLGSMATVLKGKSPLDKMVQNRIALQVQCHWGCQL